ncbi:TRAP transporter substrate-binding protein DctP [Bosea sp. ASV33]|uniref:TRAP transporter substrate-binding protein DctP n=1 Tax=Bosea sp. ASV33 TaxID=2795106 RepID=UPI0024A64C7C|nr:TRAP transporter substrate-binding protein DctP [Bosea sp. ASV33]
MISWSLVLKAARLPAFAALVTLHGAAASVAADPITLKFGTTLPGNHYLSEQLYKKFMAGVERETNGEIKFEYYPASQLGKDATTLLKSGLLDMAMLIPGLAPEKYPLSAVVDLPQIAGSACEGSHKAWVLVQPGGVLDKLEYNPAGIRALSAQLLAPYALHTRSKKIEKLADVKGVKLWVSGAVQQEAVAEMGGIPIRIPSTELYDAATRGTVDGALFPYTGITQYNLEPVLKNAVSGVTFGTGLSFIGTTEKRWATLSDKHRAVIADEIGKASASFCKWADETDEGIRKKLSETSGYTVPELTPEARKEFGAALAAVGDKWAKGMDERGRPGSTVLKAIREAPGQ